MYMHILLEALLFQLNLTGTCLEKTTTRSLYQTKVPEFGHNQDEAMFAIMDGGRAPDVPKVLWGLLPGILSDEIATEKNNSSTPLRYLEHTFLTAHRYNAQFMLCTVCSYVYRCVCMSMHACVCRWVSAQITLLMDMLLCT